MSASTSYGELLRDPRWQRLRLEVMQRDGFACTLCGDTKSTLNVHHRHYERDRAPWEYQTEILRTLCESCHERVTTLRRLAVQRLNALPEEMLHVAQVALGNIGFCYEAKWFDFPGLRFKRGPDAVFVVDEVLHWQTGEVDDHYEDTLS